MSNSNLRPKSSGTQTLNFVWANDADAHVVDLSGQTSVLKKVNANDPKNGLTKLNNPDTDVWEGLWTDALGRIYKNDISGSDVSGNLFSKAFYVADNTGLKTLTNTTGNNYTFIMGDLINTLFSDQAGSPYLTSYRTSVPSSLQLNTDLSLTIVPGSLRNPDNVAIAHFTAAWTDLSNNKITFNPASFISGNDASFNPVDVDLSLNFRMTRSLLGPVVDVSNQLKVNMYKFGVDPVSTVTRYSSIVAEQTFIDLSINVLNAGSSIVIETNGSQILSHQNSTLQPNIELMNLLPSTFTFTNSGRQNLRLPFTINPRVAGQWTWSVYLKDGNMKSSSRNINLQVMPSFTAPVVTVTGETLLYKDDEYKVNLKIADDNFISDICSNLTSGLSVRPRINAVGTNLIGLDNVPSTIDRLINLTSDGTVRPLVATDLCLNTLTFSDISNTFVNRLRIGYPLDISQNESGNYYKVRDVSTNIVISNNDDISQCHLPSRSFNMFVDWLPNSELSAATSIKPQTLTIGTFNIATEYSSNVIMTDNKDGTITLSLSDNNGNLSGAKYRVKVFTNEKCDTLGTIGNITMDAQPNVDNATLNNFTVQFDSNNQATFTSPKLVANSAHKEYIMVAYLEVDSKTFLYTASNKVKFSKTNFPSLDLQYSGVAFTAADLNKIVNITADLELDTALADLSGYAIKSVDVGIDLSCNLTLPAWSINSPTLTFTVNDTNNVVKSFDISGWSSKKSSIENQIVFNNVNDVSNGGVFRIDLSYNDVKTDYLFSMNIAFSDADGNDYSQANKTVVFYYNGIYSGLPTNKGGNKNTIILYNDTKYIIDNKLDSTRITLPAIDSFDTFSWLAGSASNSYVLDLARSEFNGSGHNLDVSSFRISNVDRKGADNAILYVGFSGAWTSVITNGTGALPNVRSSSGNASHIDAAFARTNYSWIDTRKFVGTIDIDYKTKNTNGLSVDVNTLRLVVLPRPNIVLNIAQLPNTLVNNKANTTATISNLAKNKDGSNITSISSWTPRDISGSKFLTGKLRTMMSVSSGAISLVTKTGTPDIANASSFVLSSVGNIQYGQVAMPIITFNGRSTAGLVSSNIRATYSAFGSRSIQSAITELSVAVYSTDSTFNNSAFTNNLTANNVINCAGMPFVQYMTLDNSNNSLNLDTNLKTKNAVFVIVENIGSITATVNATYLTTVASTVTTTTGASFVPNTTTPINVVYTPFSNNTQGIAAGDEHVYQHTAVTGWIYLYKKQ